MEGIRINKYLAQCGVCSRREADKLIEQGKVWVNGEPAGMGLLVSKTDEIRVNKKLLQGPKKNVVLAYYKPVGVTCTEKDRHADIKITDVIQYPVRVTYAGRLDKDSEGLLLLTNDGDLINAMMRGAHCHEKEYIVKVDRRITPDFLAGMSAGVYLEELDITTRQCKIEEIGEYTFRIILTQGVNRQVRRMCQSFGYHVKSLKRVRVINVKLGDLKPGKYRELEEDEMKILYRQCGMLNKSK